MQLGYFVHVRFEHPNLFDAGPDRLPVAVRLGHLVQHDLESLVAHLLLLHDHGLLRLHLQLPADLRDSVKRIRVFGPREQAQRLVDEIRPRFEPGGLKVELVATYPAGEFSRTIPSDTPVSGAFSLVARQLTGRTDPFEFLPPKISAWQRVAAKYTSGKLRTAGAAAAVLLLIVFALFGYQQWQLTKLRSQWAKMSTKVGELKAVEAQIKQYRPWFDSTFHYLVALRDITRAFPENGSVTAKTIEIRDWNTVNCSGTAQNNTALIDTQHRLGAVEGFSVSVLTAERIAALTGTEAEVDLEQAWKDLLVAQHHDIQICGLLWI